MLQHWVKRSNSKWPMINCQWLDFIDSEIKVAETCLELIFDIPCLTLIDHAYFRTCESASIVRARDSYVGYGHAIV